MKKILFVARLDEHIRHFHLPYLKWFKENGYTVDLVSDKVEDLPYLDNHIRIPMKRNPLHPTNLKAYKDLDRLIKDKGYDLVHCHMPLSGILARFAARKQRKKGLKVLYTAHGFHFFKGAPLLNWLIYYPIEKIASLYTDCIITINSEDYEVAKNKLHAKSIEIVNGVGINTDKFSVPDKLLKEKLREKNLIKNDDFVMIYVAELSHRKHQDLLINAMKILKDQIPEMKLLLVGQGAKEAEYSVLISNLGLEDEVKLLGYRNDVDELMSLSDLALSASRQEGLPVNIMEAMGTGIPIVATDCRGNRDLVTNNVNGYITGLDSSEEMAEKILDLYNNEDKRNKFGLEGRKMIGKYSIHSVLEEMKEIYLKYLNN